MQTRSRIFATVLGTLALLLPLAFADASSVSVQSLSPGSTVFAKDTLTFSVLTSGFNAQRYQFSDSFPNSTASVSNVDGGGNFFWVPLPSDIGTHTFTLTSSDYSNNTANTTLTVIVVPAPTISISTAAAGAGVTPGTNVSFSVSQAGFVNPTYGLSDSFSGSSIGNVSIDSSGHFSWTPDLAQEGDHIITVNASDSTGHRATASQSVHVGPWPTLTVFALVPGTQVTFGTTTSFMVSPTAFTPSLFSLADSFPGSSLSNNNITTTGIFSWIPQPNDVGVHVVTVMGSVGPFGQSASTTQTLIVYAPGGVIPALPPVTTTPAPTPTPTPTPVITPPETPAAPVLGGSFTLALSTGSTGDEVTHLQNVLLGLGLFTGTPSGYYGALTTAAVVKFQTAHGLAQVGNVGPATRAALNALSTSSSASGSETPAPPSAPTTPATPSPAGDGYVFNNFMGYGEDTTDGADVTELQKRLLSLGFFSGDATGYFGNVTASAVKKFQTVHGIPATGFVGSLTRAALNQ